MRVGNIWGGGDEGVECWGGGGCYGIDGEDRGVVEGGGTGAPIHPLYFRRRFSQRFEVKQLRRPYSNVL